MSTSVGFYFKERYKCSKERREIERDKEKGWREREREYKGEREKKGERGRDGNRERQREREKWREGEVWK